MNVQSFLWQWFVGAALHRLGLQNLSGDVIGYCTTEGAQWRSFSIVNVRNQQRHLSDRLEKEPPAIQEGAHRYGMVFNSNENM